MLGELCNLHKYLINGSYLMQWEYNNISLVNILESTKGFLLSNYLLCTLGDQKPPESHIY